MVKARARRPAGAWLWLLCLCCAALPGCATSWPVEEDRPAAERPRPAPGAGPEIIPQQPSPEAERLPRTVPMPAPAPAPEVEALPPSYHPAGEALVEQARREAMLGDEALAGATLERALRVDGGNPWIWIELGHLRLGAGQRAAAESMGRKALSLANRDPAARAAANELLRQAGDGP